MVADGGGGSRARAVRQTNGNETSGSVVVPSRNSLTITGLKSGTEYDITITVTNPAGNSIYVFTRSTASGTSGSKHAS